MSSPSTRIAVVCACLLAGGSAAAQPGSNYNPPPRIVTAPAAFGVGRPINVTASFFNKPTNAAHPNSAQLRIVTGDANGNVPATGGAYSNDRPLGPQDWSHWSNVTFPMINVPSVPKGRTLVLEVTYRTWSAYLGKYRSVTGTGNVGSAVFKWRCSAATGVCGYQRL